MKEWPFVSAEGLQESISETFNPERRADGRQWSRLVWIVSTEADDFFGESISCGAAGTENIIAG
jgi:hypothetical protein